MTRFGSPVFWIALGAGLLGCGSSSTAPSPKNILDLVPADGTVPGWTADQEHSKSPGERAMTANDEKGVESLIDGGAEDYFLDCCTPTKFAWQNYLNPTLPSAAPEVGKVKLYIFQMPSAEQAAGIYAGLLQKPAWQRKSGSADDWQPPSSSLGAGSRIQDTSTQWWVNFYKDVFYVEVLLYPSFGPEPDVLPGNPDNKAEAIRFAQAVASKI